MNFFTHRYANLPRFCFDENADGSGGGSPAASSGPTAGASPSNGGAAPAPSSTSPVGGEGGTPSPAVEGGPATNDSDPFFGLDNDFDSIDLGAETTPSQDPPAAAPASVVPPAAAPAPPAPPPAEAAPAPAASAPAANESATPRSPLEEALQGFKAGEKELSAWAGQNLFKLSPEDAEALDTNAVEVIPRLMGQVYVQAMQAAANLMRNFVPGMIDSRVEAVSGAKSRASEAMNEFYAAHPHLNAKDHQSLVDTYAKAYRAAHPKASRAEAIKAVGTMVSAVAGIAPQVAAPARAQPFAPARPGGRQQVNGAQQVGEFDGLDMDFDE